MAVSTRSRFKSLQRWGRWVCALAFLCIVAAAPDAHAEGGLIVDLETRQVYVPDVGWLSEADFWVLYHEEPEKLPGDIDFEALRELGYPVSDPTPPEEPPAE